MNNIGFKIQSGINKSDNLYHIKLEGNIAINEIINLKSSLESINPEGDDIVIDLKKIDSLDLTTIQLFCSYGKELADNGKLLRINCGTELYVVDLMCNTGFGEMINIRQK